MVPSILNKVLGCYISVYSVDLRDFVSPYTYLVCNEKYIYIKLKINVNIGTVDIHMYEYNLPMFARKKIAKNPDLKYY